MAALAATVFVSAAAFIVPLFVLVAAVMLIAQRSSAGIVASLGLIALAVLASMGLLGAITVKGGGGITAPFDVAFGTAFAVTAALGVPAAATWVLWYDPVKMPMRYTGLAAALLGAVLAFVFRGDLTTQTSAATWVVVLCCLASSLCVVPFFTSHREPAPRATGTAVPAPDTGDARRTK